MLISQKSKEIIDSCRFCWMCRHICPIGNATGLERNTARARALALSIVERGAEPLESVADNVYECALCSACTNDCATGWDPVKFTKEVRTELAANGVTPDYINKLLDNLDEKGNIYGLDSYCDCLKDAISSLNGNAKTLLFLGKDAIYKSTKNAVKAIELLKKAGIDFAVLENEPDSGCMYDTLIGAAAETKEVMENTAKVLNGYDTIICYDPSDAKVFLREYKEWDINLTAKIVTFTSFIASLIENGTLKVKNSGKAYTFQDPPALARDLEETDCARAILAACGENREMLLNGKHTVLAGSLMMNEYMPGVMKEVAARRITNAVNMKGEIMVTACPAEYELLNANKGDKIEVMTIEEVVLSCL